MKNSMWKTLGRSRHPHNRPSSGESANRGLWAALVTVVLGVTGAVLMTMVVQDPSKRNVELLAGLIFLGFVLVAHPFKALLFTLVVLPFPAYTSVGTTSTLLIFALAGLVMVKSQQLPSQSTPAHKKAALGVSVYLLMILLSLYQQDLSDSAPIVIFLTGIFSAVLLYYVVIRLVTNLEEFRRVLALSQFMSFVLAIIANLQSMFPTKTILPAFFKFSRVVASMEEVRAGDIRSFATFPGYELYGEYCALSIFLQYVLWRQARSNVAKAFWLVAIITTLLALFGTATRAGLIILVFGTGYLVLQSGKAIPRASVLRAILASFAIFYMTLPFTYPRLEIMLSRFETIGTKDSSVQSRSVVMEQALKAIPDSPFIGHGVHTPPGTFRGGVSQHIHSLYVTTAYKMGIPALVAFVWFLSILFRISLSRSRGTRGPPDAREFMLVLHVTLVMWMVDQIKIEYTRDPITMHMTWFHFGLIMALDNIIQKSSQGHDMGRRDYVE